MLELILAGGPMMAPILLASVVAAAITVERVWTLLSVGPDDTGTLQQVVAIHDAGQVSAQWVRDLREQSPLGRVLAAVLVASSKGREAMKETVVETMEQVQHELERFLTVLGIVAEVTPLMGLLGTVMGMIKVFSVIMTEGTGQANLLAGGISEALITTAAGIGVAIPAMISYRLLHRRVESICLSIEHDAHRLVEHVVRQAALRGTARPAGREQRADAAG